MKPTTPKKLALTHETLVRLSPAHLDTIVGGATDRVIPIRTCLWNSCKPAR